MAKITPLGGVLDGIPVRKGEVCEEKGEKEEVMALNPKKKEDLAPSQWKKNTEIFLHIKRA